MLRAADEIFIAVRTQGTNRVVHTGRAPLRFVDGGTFDADGNQPNHSIVLRHKWVDFHETFELRGNNKRLKWTWKFSI